MGLRDVFIIREAPVINAWGKNAPKRGNVAGEFPDPSGWADPEEKEDEKEPEKKADEPKGEEKPEKEIPYEKERLYYDALGRATYAANRRDSADDPEDKEHWRNRRRTLAKVVDKLGKAYGLPTMADLHKQLGSD